MLENLEISRTEYEADYYCTILFREDEDISINS